MIPLSRHEQPIEVWRVPRRADGWVPIPPFTFSFAYHPLTWRTMTAAIPCCDFHRHGGYYIFAIFFFSFFSPLISFLLGVPRDRGNGEITWKTAPRVTWPLLTDLSPLICLVCRGLVDSLPPPAPSYIVLLGHSYVAVVL
ncbi:unnamed protein product [Musa acuminata subsp. burmannicoides]